MKHDDYGGSGNETVKMVVAKNSKSNFTKNAHIPFFTLDTSSRRDSTLKYYRV